MSPHWPKTSWTRLRHQLGFCRSHLITHTLSHGKDSNGIFQLFHTTYCIGHSSKTNLMSMRIVTIKGVLESLTAEKLDKSWPWFVTLVMTSLSGRSKINYVFSQHFFEGRLESNTTVTFPIYYILPRISHQSNTAIWWLEFPRQPCQLSYRVCSNHFRQDTPYQWPLSLPLGEISPIMPKQPLSLRDASGASSICSVSTLGMEKGS